MDLLSEFLFALGSVICHQRPERSFFVDGHQLPVCARCTGLYLSGVAGVLGWLAWKIARPVHLAVGARCTVQLAPTGSCTVGVDPRVAVRALVLGAIPTAVSLFTGALGIWDGSNITRALLAIPLGAIAGAIVAAVATKDLR
jgi:uncharacterized membrane protein